MKTHHVLGLSGGKDSAALAIFMSQNFPELAIEYFFTDTGKELPEVYDFLSRLEGALCKPINRLGAGAIDGRERDFDWWLRRYGYFLPSAQTRWCTRKLKLEPFQNWVKPLLEAGDAVVQYVAIRSDEDHRQGLWSTDRGLTTKMPFIKAGIDKEGVIELLNSSGIGLPKYYEWRSRSGCTFCFFQQKIEWVRLRETHPERFEEAKRYEKTALTHGSPFTWTQGEPLEMLERPERIHQIKADFEIRKKRVKAKQVSNPLKSLDGLEYDDIDEILTRDEGGGACLVCHK
jgi:3'-phosphoadenosine 5'-phosphosulfate sulfotransferase (PAPS reductase)/FAD synthetase